MSAIMSDAEAQIAARSPEEQRLVRSFSIDEASGSEPGNIVHAVADYGEEARQREAARWRLQFQDQNAARYVPDILISRRLILMGFQP